jgi:quercetin dioxygenase-like cupin family protein
MCGKYWLALGLIVSRTALTTKAQQSAAPTCAIIPVDATDGVTVAPANHKVLYESPDIRVLEVTVPPHTVEPMHTHARPAIMYIDGFTSQKYITPADPDPAPRSFPPRPVTIRLKPEGPHAIENTGDVPFHAIRIELKHPGCSLPNGFPLVTPDSTDALFAAPNNHSLLYEDGDVRVLDIHSSGHTREPWHTHAWPGIFYVIQGVPTRYFTPQTPDPPLRPAPSPDRKIIPVPAETSHSVGNMGDGPSHRLRIELKHATPAPPATAMP